jgi:hypothetical protein
MSSFFELMRTRCPCRILPPGHQFYYNPGSASENDSELSNSKRVRWSQQSSHTFTVSEEINPSAINSRVSSHGQKYSPQCLQRIFMILSFKLSPGQQKKNILHPESKLCGQAK